MDMLREFLPCKIEHITSSLYRSVLLWTSKIPLFSIRKIPNNHHPPSNYKIDLFQVSGLKTLALNQHHHNSEQEENLLPRVVHCYTVIPSTSPEPYSEPPPLLPSPPSMFLSSSYAFKCTMIGDVLGAESGDCMMDQLMIMKTEQPPEEENSMMVQSKLTRKEKEKEKMNREIIPPPITLLRITRDTAGRMRWGFKRECYDDGRVIIRAERVRLHEQVEFQRQNGRLTMNLVPGDDDDDDDDEDIEYCEECGYPMEEEEEVVECEDIEFNQEGEGLESEKEEEGGFEIDFEMAKEEEEEEGDGNVCWDLRDCVAYAGSVQDSGSFWAGNGVGDANGLMGRAASASASTSSSAPLRPITSVM